MYKFVSTRQAPPSPSFCISEVGITGYLSQGVVAKMKWVNMCVIHIKTNSIAITMTIVITERSHQLPSCVTLGQLPNFLMFHVSHPYHGVTVIPNKKD